MNLKDLEHIYGHEKMEMVLAMMGAGWNSKDTAEDIYEAHKNEGCTMEEAEEIMKIIIAVEDVMGGE